jgi:hypothetical protein
MNRLRIEDAPTHSDIDWTPFPGGELEGQYPKALCPDCRAKGRLASHDMEAPGGKAALCFQCYRAGIERSRRIKAAGELNTASEARFQASLPFEPVNVSRLARLKIEREQARVAAGAGAGRYVEKRRRAQIEARHALARIFQGLKQRRLVSGDQLTPAGLALDAATRAAELQLPESWLPFVVSR